MSIPIRINGDECLLKEGVYYLGRMGRFDVVRDAGSVKNMSIGSNIKTELNFIKLPRGIRSGRVKVYFDFTLIGARDGMVKAYVKEDIATLNVSVINVSGRATTADKLYGLNERQSVEIVSTCALILSAEVVLNEGSVYNWI